MKTFIARCAVLLLLAVGGAIVSTAHDPISTKITWDREISRIMFARCASCHHEGGTAFSMLTYLEARPWAKAIKEEVLERRMPPFAAIKGFGEVKDEEALTQEELHLIADWVEGGSPEGDEPQVLPKPPEFKSGKAPGMTAKTAGKASDKPAGQLIADGTITLKEPITLIGARAGTMSEGASVQAVAQKPDGTIEPLIWIYDYKPKFDRAYMFAKPVALPAGSKIELYPANAGTLALLLKK